MKSIFGCTCIYSVPSVAPVLTVALHASVKTPQPSHPVFPIRFPNLSPFNF